MGAWRRSWVAGAFLVGACSLVDTSDLTGAPPVGSGLEDAGDAASDGAISTDSGGADAGVDALIPSFLCGDATFCDSFDDDGGLEPRWALQTTAGDVVKDPTHAVSAPNALAAHVTPEDPDAAPQVRVAAAFRDFVGATRLRLEARLQVEAGSSGIVSAISIRWLTAPPGTNGTLVILTVNANGQVGTQPVLTLLDGGASTNFVPMSISFTTSRKLVVDVDSTNGKLRVLVDDVVLRDEGVLPIGGAGFALGIGADTVYGAKAPWSFWFDDVRVWAD